MQFFQSLLQAGHLSWAVTGLPMPANFRWLVGRLAAWTELPKSEKPQFS